MKGTADFHLKVEFSLLQAATADANGAAIDCKGFDEALPFIGHGAIGGSGGGPFSSDVNWEESANNSTWAAITGAVHKQCLLSLALIVASVNIAASATHTIAAQPANPARLVVTIVDTTPSITAGTVYIVGTRPPRYGETGSQVVAELIDCAAGAGTYKTTAIFDSVTSIKSGVVSGVSGTVAFATLGGSGDETIKVGVDNTGVQVPHEARINLVNRKRYLRAVNNATGSSPTGALAVGLVLMSPRNKGIGGFNHTVPAEFNVT